MKLAAFLLLWAGWVIAMTAVIVLPSPGARAAFLLAGMAVEAVGLVIAFRVHRPIEKEERS